MGLRSSLLNVGQALWVQWVYNCIRWGPTPYNSTASAPVPYALKASKKLENSDRGFFFLAYFLSRGNAARPIVTCGEVGKLEN